MIVHPPYSPVLAVSRRILCSLATTAVMLSLATAALAQTTGTQGAFKGFGSSKDPIQIEADNLGVASADQVVTITGNVQVRQRETTLTSQTMKIFYDQTAPSGAADPSGAGQLRRIEAAGGVKITQPGQAVTGEQGWFDLTTQKAEITGHVVLTQCNNAAKGSRLLINLKTGEYRLEGGQEGKRIQMSIQPDQKTGTPADGKCR